MKIEIKQLEGTKWIPIPLKNIIGNSIINFMLNSETKVIAALTQEGKHLLFVSNNEEVLEQYKEKATCISVKDMVKFMGTAVYSPLMVSATEVFPDIQLSQIGEE